MLVQRPIRKSSGRPRRAAQRNGSSLPDAAPVAQPWSFSGEIASGGVPGYVVWLAWQLAAVLCALPVGLALLLKLLLSPRRMLHRKDRSGLQLPDPLPGLTHEWIETAPGIRIHTVRTSKGSGKPLMLLVHGFPEAWFVWAGQMAAFREQYEVVAIDMRGYGESSKPKARPRRCGWLSYHLDLLTADLKAVAEHLLAEAGQRQLVLAGHDWGGHMAWCLACACPQLVSHLVALCVPHPGLYHRNRDWLQRLRHGYVLLFQVPWLLEAALCADDYALLECVLTRPPGGCAPGTVSEEYLERYKQAFGRSGVPSASLHYYRAVNNARFPSTRLNSTFMRQLSVPVLMLWGERDINLSQALLRDTDKYVDRLRIEVVPGSSHWMLHDCPMDVTRLVTAFLHGSP